MTSAYKICLLSLLVLSVLWAVSCQKSSSTSKPATTGDFWYGNIIGTNNFVGPGNAILLRTDGTMREYANDYSSAGTTMGPNDTGSAAIKIDGTYSTSTVNGKATVNTTWYNASNYCKYVTFGTISGNTMTGAFNDTSTLGSGYTTATFSFSNGQ